MNLSKFILFAPIFFTVSVSFSKPSQKESPTLSPRPLAQKKKAIEKQLLASSQFEKKVKILAAFQNWTDQEIKTHADTLSDDELSELMHLSNLLRVLNPKKLQTPHCKAATKKIIDEDLTPLSQTLSASAKTLIHWIKILCPSSPSSQDAKK